MTAAEFWAKVDKNGPVIYRKLGRCWVCKKRKSRQAWKYAHGAIPEKLRVLHKCDNTLCVRPSHLFLGTQKDNMLDKSRKGRAVVTPEHREKIRKALLGRKHSQETRRKIGLASKGRQSMLGRHHTLESREKMRQSALHRKSWPKWNANLHPRGFHGRFN